MTTRVIFSSILPFKGFLAMSLWPFIFVRSSAAARYSVYVNNHEHIHAEQQKEMLAAGGVLAVLLALAGCGWWSLLAVPIFYWWYGAEWIVRLIQHRDAHKAYRSIRFESEAYDNEKNLEYLSHRKPFAWARLLHRCP